MSENSYSEIHVHQVENLITVQRHSPENHNAIYMIVHTAFNYNQPTLSAYAATVKIPARYAVT